LRRARHSGAAHGADVADARDRETLGGDLEVLEGFFARRLDMSMATRQALAQRIAAAIQAKSGLHFPEGASVETFLEATARQLRDLARLTTPQGCRALHHPFSQAQRRLT
jgi:hypothetical protein